MLPSGTFRLMCSAAEQVLLRIEPVNHQVSSSDLSCTNRAAKRKASRDEPPPGSGRSYRCGSSSARSADFDFAPTIRSFASPSLNKISVGMLITSKRCAVLRLSSTFSFMT